MIVSSGSDYAFLVGMLIKVKDVLFSEYLVRGAHDASLPDYW